VGCVCGSFGVVAQEVVARNIEQVGDSGCFKFRVSLSQGSVVGVVEGFFLRLQPGVGKASIFDEDDGGIGLCGSQLVHQGDGFFRNTCRVHVRQAVDDDHSGGKFGYQVADFFVHSTVA